MPDVLVHWRWAPQPKPNHPRKPSEGPGVDNDSLHIQRAMLGLWRPKATGSATRIVRFVWLLPERAVRAKNSHGYGSIQAGATVAHVTA